MTTLNRSAWATFLLILISLPITLFLYRKVQQAVVRHEMKEKLELSLLQTIEIPAASVQWYKKEKEILVEGRLFDVKSYKAVPGTNKVLFTGLFDEEETAIVQKINQLARRSERQKTGDHPFYQAIWLLLYPPQPAHALRPAWLHLKNHFPIFLTSGLPDADLSIPSPPPK